MNISYIWLSFSFFINFHKICRQYIQITFHWNNTIYSIYLEINTKTLVFFYAQMWFLWWRFLLIFFIACVCIILWMLCNAAANIFPFPLPFRSFLLAGLYSCASVDTAWQVLWLKQKLKSKFYLMWNLMKIYIILHRMSMSKMNF